MSTTTDRVTTDWHVRAPTPDELSDFVRPVHMAFAGMFSSEELDDWLELAEPERWLGAFSEPGSGVVAGVVSAFSLRLTVPGGEIDAAGVTGVGVRPDHRRRGVLRALIGRQLTDVRERGEPVAILWASESSIYGRFGYGPAVMDGAIEVPTERTSFTHGLYLEGRVRIVDEEESLRSFPPVYEHMRAVTPGAVSREQAWWMSLLADPEYGRRGAGPKYRVLYETDGRAEGYAIYHVREGWDDRGPRAVLELKEAVHTTPRSLHALWRYLFDLDLVRTLKAERVPVPSPLQYVLAEPRALGLVAKDGLWLRLVDLPAALSGRRYGMADSLVLEVSDAFCGWDAGRWRLTTSGAPRQARAEVSRTDEPADLALDTADLAALYLGGTRASDLAAAGRIGEVVPGALARTDALFASPRAPWCATLF